MYLSVYSGPASYQGFSLWGVNQSVNRILWSETTSWKPMNQKALHDSSLSLIKINRAVEESCDIIEEAGMERGLEEGGWVFLPMIWVHQVLVLLSSVVYFQLFFLCLFFFLHVNTELRGKPTAEGWERGRGRGGTVGGREGWGSWNKLTLIYCTVAKLRHD